MRIRKKQDVVGAVGVMATEYTEAENAYYNAPYVNSAIKDTYETGYIASSQMTSATIGGTQSRTYDLTFSKTYTTPPTVIVSTYHNASLSNYGFVQCAVNNITTTGCKLLFANNMSHNDYGINYLVISND